MDRRIDALLNELENSVSIDPKAVRDRIIYLFDEVTDEQDRVALLGALDAVIGLAIRSQETQGIDSVPLRNALLSDKRLLVIKEAMGANQLVDPTAQLRILEREIAANRMENDEFYELTFSGARVFGSQHKQPKGAGLMARIFRHGRRTR